ncbi:hypothetical protein IQ07DRAFT_640677 [Pyrenochaeta sp. DS3sAY3a]|nr:hypothetical protein IQ07DRAFT_640677 [Pyrenochaeta sp. DS3sAY3a]
MVQEKSLSNEELTKAIDIFCQDGTEIVGFGRSKPWLDKMFKWPSSDNPRFLMGAIFNGEGMPFVNDKANWKPYKDMRWCDNYDWKMGKDDCTFAMRKMHKECTHDRVLKVADFTYRCVRYQYAYPTLEE